MQSTAEKLVRKIERLLGKRVRLHPAPPYSADANPLHGLLAFKQGQASKYLADDQGRLIGLNLSATGLNDAEWQLVASLLQESGVRLQGLALNGNRLRNFVPPPAVDELTALALDDNPLVSPPPDVAKLGNEAILQWLRAKDKRPVLEAKVMFIGDSSCGKTHLIEMLRHGAIKRRIDTTHGIERCRLRDADSKEGSIRLNVWDLGGQTFMRSTHQLFFTERTLYVLVAEARKEREPLNHWLNLVHELGADAPVLVAINKIDANEHDVDRNALRRDYPNIADFVRTACFDSTPDSRGQGVIALDTIRALEAAIHRIVGNPAAMPSVFARQRPEWFAVKEQLESMTEEYISYDAYRQRPYIKDLSAEEQRRNLKQLASLGTVVSFVDDHRLNDTHVINPQWLLDGIYAVINDSTIKEQRQGEFCFADLRRLLDATRYPESKYGFLVDLMEKFRLCHPVRQKKDVYLLPDLLADIEPPNAWPHAAAEVMRFRLCYDGFPPELFVTQFIAERYRDIVDGQRWRSGAVVQDPISGCQAVVRRSFRGDRIEIEVAGPERSRRSFLHVLLNVFKDLHQPYNLEERRKVRREIPYKQQCWLNYDHLLTLEKHRWPYFHPELEEEVPVSEVLDGYRQTDLEDESERRHAEIVEKIDGLLERMADHHQETHADHARQEKKTNAVRREQERLTSELRRLAACSIDPRKLELRLDEVRGLLTEMAGLPELAQRIPELTTQLAMLNQAASKQFSVKVVASLLPEVLQKLLPMMPNIQVECDLTEQIRFKGLVQRLLAIGDSIQGTGG